MLVCKRCLLEKEPTEFHISSKNRSGYYTYCKLCRSILSKKSYDTSIDKQINIKNKNKIRSDKNKKLIRRYKSLCGCKFCFISDPIVLDFHHLDGIEKENNVASLVSYSRKTLILEIKKCIVVCSNCHRLLHAGKLKLT